MAYNYEYEEYIEKKHNLRFDAINAIAKSERLKKPVTDDQCSIVKDNIGITENKLDPLTDVKEFYDEVDEEWLQSLLDWGRQNNNQKL